MLALNNTWLPSNNTVVTLRYGWNRFLDNNTLSIDFDPSALGFPSSFLNATAGEEVPAGARHRLRQQRFRPHAGRHRSGQHQLSLVGGERHGVEADGPAHVEGRLRLPIDRNGLPVVRQRRRASSASIAASPRWTRNSNGGNQGNAFASFLLGYPSGDPGNISTVGVSTPLEVVHQLLRLLRAGRLPRESEAHVELRPPARARGRACRSGTTSSPSPSTGR